jgi:uncharacterized protein YceK
MKKSSTIIIIVIIALSGLSGCATIQKPDPYEQEQKRKLALARMLLEDNRISAAKEILAAMSDEKMVSGVTDEAIFRLALLNLAPGEQKIQTNKAGRNLEKLLKSSPSSPWKPHAATLKGVLDAYDLSLEENAELEKTVRSLKNSNLSLGKEIRELRQDIEKLKKLDLELERKKKK